jgi:uncharacterized protein (TIGR01777 family)
MKVIIAGGSGFLGRRLGARLLADAHDVVVFTRGSSRPQERDGVPGVPERGGHAAAPPTERRARTIVWSPTGEIGPWASEIDGAGAVVNLAGESIAGRRWSAAHKARILDSRIGATRSLAAAIRGASAPPPVFVSGSAVGYYGPRGEEPVTEDHPAGADFLAGVCVQWEREASRAASDRTRVVCVRTGLVLAKDGGALPEMLPPFRLGAGGPVGSGRQYWPWIHFSDWVSVVRWAIGNPAVSGAVNATAPNPVTNKAFATALGRAMHRPAFMPAPGLALRLLLGEMADALLLSGQRALPAKAQRLGFTFQFANIEEALASIFASHAK